MVLSNFAGYSLICGFIISKYICSAHTFSAHIYVYINKIIINQSTYVYTIYVLEPEIQMSIISYWSIARLDPQYKLWRTVKSLHLCCV